MYEYRHGGNVHAESGSENFLDLSASLNPLGFPKQIEDVVHREIKNCNRYPDNNSTRLCEAIAKFEHVSPDTIFCAGGSSDIIFRLASCVKNRPGLVLVPSFSDYSRAMKSRDMEIVYHPLDEETGFQCNENLLNTIEITNPGILFFCNPNNPTGVLTPRSFIEELLHKCSKAGTLAVIDECFIDFCEKAIDATAKPLLHEYANLVVLKAFTKIFDLPGLRLGYAICTDPAVIELLHYHGPDWPVSNLAQSAGIAVLNNAEGYIISTIEYVLNERKYIVQELQNLGYIVYDSSANFVFFKNPYDFDLKKKLDNENIRIRSFDAFDGLGPEYCRVGVSQFPNNIRFIEAMQKITPKTWRNH